MNIRTPKGIKEWIVFAIIVFICIFIIKSCIYYGKHLYTRHILKPYYELIEPGLNRVKQDYYPIFEAF